MDRTKPYIEVVRGEGNTAAIRVIMPDGSRLGVAMQRTVTNRAAFDYLVEKLKDGLNF